MASTRNINTPGNYQMEQRALNKRYNESMYSYSSQGKPFTRYFAGDGLLAGNMKGRDLAKNDCDIESYLFGIGSTNLVNPLPIIQPKINTIQSLNIYQKSPTIPSPIIQMEPNQRYMYLN